MNSVIFILMFCTIIASDIYMYWDLGVAVSKNAHKDHNVHNIELSAFNRIAGLKKYYVNDFSGAIFHFEELTESVQQLILYEYIHSYYSLGENEKALSILHHYENLDFSDNILYLKSKILTTMGHYDEAIIVLNYIKNELSNSDYLDIIQFDLEKINLLK